MTPGGSAPAAALPDAARAALFDSQINLRRASRLLAELVGCPEERASVVPAAAGREIAHALNTIRHGRDGLDRGSDRQRLDHASAVLTEVESRLGAVARMVDIPEPVPAN